MSSSHDDGIETWLAAEPPLGSTLRGLILRLGHRGLTSWFVWVPLAMALSAVVAIRSVHRRSFEATVVLRVIEGEVRSLGMDLGNGVLRSYVEDRALTNPNLLEVMSRHPRAFLDRTAEPAESVQAMRSAIELSITENDFVEERGPDDPPRSARIAVTYHAGEPALALAIARELAELVVASTLSIEKRDLARQRAATASALGKAEAQFDEETASPTGGGESLVETSRERLRATVALAGKAHLASRAGDEQQVLQFDLVDAGRAPPPRTKAFFVRQLGATLALALLAGLFFAGSFDPRILDRSDLGPLGITALGRTPALPALRKARKRHETPVPPSTSA